MAILRIGSFIFVPLSCRLLSEVVPRVLLSPQDVYWHESIIFPRCGFSKVLSNLYPRLHDFFVNECGVNENPPLLDYLEFLHHLATVDTPLQAAKKVFDVFVTWSDGIKSGVFSVEDVENLKRNLEEKEVKVLPTTQNRWVSLHPSFGLVCWSDDENLADEFKLYNINLVHFYELSDEENEMLHTKISVLMKVLGIPALSEAVTREAIYYGPVNNRFETLLVNRVLPYAQRYIYNLYREVYLQQKLSGFEKLNRLQIIVVEKLYYNNIIIGRSKLTSETRHATRCLLQDNILYATRDSDSHSIFMELTRFLISGNPELHLANFLHIVTTMIESGFSEEEIDSFILNSQKVPKLPDEEPVWSLQPIEPVTCNMESSSAKPRKSKRTVMPPNSWLRSNRYTPPPRLRAASRANDTNMQIDLGACGMKEHVISTNQVENLERFKSSSDEVREGTNSVTHVKFEPLLVDQDGPSSFSQKDQLHDGSENMQRMFTGKQGEEVMFNYYSKKDGIKYVKWVNEDRETGLPYDLEVYDEEFGKEYIEVKTTDSAGKDWFEISAREWEFAVEEGEFFSIARVILSGGGTAQVAIIKNPARLCQLGHLKLAILMPKQQSEG